MGQFVTPVVRGVSYDSDDTAEDLVTLDDLLPEFASQENMYILRFSLKTNIARHALTILIYTDA